MWLRKIKLQNWSGYQDMELKFPEHKARKNVILIGAENGVGKTRLLEAATLCLFGEEGAQYLARAESGGAVNRKKYVNFINSAYRKNEHNENAAVRMEFENYDNDEKLTIERKWFFNNQNIYENEKVEIVENDKIFEVGALEDSNEKKRTFIAEKIMPPSLIPFFFFDSDMVQKHARLDMQQQVKAGIENILGVRVLRTLTSDLTKYADDKQREIVNISDATIQKLQQEIDNIESEIEKKKKEIKLLDEKLASNNADLDEYLKQYQNPDNMQNLGALRQKLAEEERDSKECKSMLEKILVKEIGMSIAASNLSVGVCEQLQQEINRNDWERDKDVGEHKFQKFMDNLGDISNITSPPLSDDTIAVFEEKIKDAWDKIWHPMPDNCAVEFLYSKLNLQEKHDAIKALGQIQSFRSNIMEWLVKSNTLNVSIDSTQGKINTLLGTSQEFAEELRQKIKGCQEKSTEYTKQKTELERAIQSMQGDLGSKKADLQRQIAKQKLDDPDRILGEKAQSVCRLISDIIHSAYPQHVKTIAEKMTTAYVSMAHKNDVVKIEITDDCEVKLLNTNGKNLRALDPSHGESQIFTLALIAAIVKASSKIFPFIIDTPLGNLDTMHRHQFLQYYSAEMENQIILLTTNEEVRQREFVLLSDKLSEKMLISRKSKSDGTHQNVVSLGNYFF